MCRARELGAPELSIPGAPASVQVNKLRFLRPEALVVFEKYERLLAKVELRNPPFPIAFWLAPRPTDFGSRLRAEFIALVLVRDRETGRPSELLFSAPVALDREPMLGAEEAECQFFLEVEAALRSVFEHEFREAFHIDGRRVRDPHAVGSPF